MKKISWQVKLGTVLILMSAALYSLHFVIFRDAEHIFKYSLHELAFIPIEVLVVTLIIHEMLNSREKKAMLGKLNMVIGVFFSEVGSSLLGYSVQIDNGIDELRKVSLIDAHWNSKDYKKAIKYVETYSPKIQPDGENLIKIRDFLVSKRNFLLRLLENPNLLEHETFTELLWAVFHLTEELESRDNLNKLQETDLKHLSGDTKRAYSLLIIEWLSYMKHQQHAYPYLFSLAVRKNPFDPNAKVEVLS